MKKKKNIFTFDNILYKLAWSYPPFSGSSFAAFHFIFTLQSPSFVSLFPFPYTCLYICFLIASFSSSTSLEPSFCSLSISAFNLCSSVLVVLLCDRLNASSLASRSSWNFLRFASSWELRIFAWCRAFSTLS